MGNNKKTTRRLALLLAMVCVAALAAGCKSEEQIQQQQVQEKEKDAVFVDLRSTLTVKGEGKVKLTPDKATLYFTVRTRQEKAEAAQQENAEATEALLAALEDLGVAQEDINTGAVNVYEQYNYEKNPPTVEGYEVSCELTVTVWDTDTVGAVITGAVAAGATEVRGPEFSVGDASAAYLEALSAALADAKAKAEAMAEGAGLRLTALPVSIQEESTNQNVAPMAAARAEAATADMAEDGGVAAPVPVSDVEVTARVSAVYEIK